VNEAGGNSSEKYLKRKSLMVNDLTSRGIDKSDVPVENLFNKREILKHCKSRTYCVFPKNSSLSS
jgi:hypothetical protein